VIGRIMAVGLRELTEIRRSRIVLTTLLVPTILYIGLPLWLLRSGALTGLLGDLAQLSPRELAAFRSVIPYAARLGPEEALQVFVVSQFLVLFMLAPLFIPLTIASYSIIGEKQLRSLEPLLATPIRTWELLLAKGLGAALPGVAVTWASYGIFAFAARQLVGEAVFRFMVSPTWLVAFLLVAPLFALLAVELAVIASSRTYDPRSAQQLGAVVILPVAGLLFAQVAGLVFLDVGVMLALAAAAAAVDLALLLLAVRLFRRETILTRWT
jgi:ABC-2 type transport system permease protein